MPQPAPPDQAASPKFSHSSAIARLVSSSSTYLAYRQGRVEAHRSECEVLDAKQTPSTMAFSERRRALPGFDEALSTVRSDTLPAPTLDANISLDAMLPPTDGAAGQ